MYAGHHDNLYQEATLFDQAFAAAMHRIQAWLPARRDHRWHLALRTLAAMFVLLSAVSLFQGLQNANTAGAQLVAVLATGGLMAMTHFLLNQCRPATTRKLQASAAAPAAAPASQADPVPLSESASRVTSAQPAATTPRDFLLAVREAGVNVRIAKALYTAGIRNSEAVRRSPDDTLLAIRGVGPATLRRLRETFGQA